MDYGYTFLRGPLELQAGTPKTIGEMDMDELRGYLCAKTLGNPKTCISCTGFKGCQVGQRALVLMGQYRKAWDEQSGPEQPAPKPPETTAPASKPGTQTDKDNFRAACESGNARRWLYERGYSEATAQEKLVYWVKHYPDITRQYGKKRILQKLRKVIVTSMEEPNAPQAADLPHTGATETKVEEMADQSAEAPERPEKPQENERRHLWSAEALESNHRKREAAVRKRCMEALASGDPEGYMISQGITRKAARQNLRRWQEKFPDLFSEEKGPEETEPEPDSILVQTEGSIIVKTEEDEINLSDFLRQYGVPILSETPEPIVEQKDDPEENPNRELARLMDQEVKLLEQVADLQEQIWEIRAKRRKVEEKMSH